MAVTNQAAIEKLYVTFFNRPADFQGLNYWDAQITANGGNAAAVANAFSASAEYKAIYAGQTTSSIINTIYTNLFGRGAEPAAITYWGTRLDNGTFNIGNIATSIATGAQNLDATTVANKVTAATAFSNSLTTSAQILGYETTTSGQAVKDWLKAVTSDAATLTAATTALPALITTVVSTATGVVGSTFALTAGVDTLVGTANNDTFNALPTTTATPANTLTGLDSIDGGAGIDTLNVVDTISGAAAFYNLPTGVTIKNVEIINVTTNGNVGNGNNTTPFDISSIAGVTNLNVVAAGTGGSIVKVSDTTAVSVTQASGLVTVNGGSTVTAKTGDASVITVTGAKGLTAVTLTGGQADVVTDAGAKTLTSVTLNSVTGTGANSTQLTGDALTNVTIAGNNAATSTVVVNNTTAGHTLNVTATGNVTGTTAFSTVITDAVATTIALTTTAKNSIVLTGDTLVKAVTATGAGALTLDLTGAAAATSFDGSTATGNLALTGLATGLVNIKTGTGDDSITLAGTTKVTLATGAGNDTVTLTGALAAGSNISLGDGNDTLLGTVAVAASTTGNVTVIDGGTGVNAVSSALINAGNAAQFVNFQTLSLQGGTTLDASLIAGITALSIDAASSGNYSNVTQAQSLTVNATGSTTTTLGFSGVAGTTDAYSISFNAKTTGTAAAPTAIGAGTLVINGIETVGLHSGASAGVAANSITLTDSTLQTLTIDGAQALTLAFAGTNGTVTAGVGGVSLIDGSAATAKLNINEANLTIATGGITIKGGSAADTLTTSTFASTLTGGAGADNFVVAATVAGGASTTAPVFTTITDASSTDIITFKAPAGAGVDNGFTATKINVTAATDLNSAIALAAAANAGGAADTVAAWFQFGTNTYIVEHVGAGAGATAADVVVKLVGTIDLSAAAYSTIAHTLTLA